MCEYSIAAIAMTGRASHASHRGAYATARADIPGLAEKGLLNMHQMGKREQPFTVPDDLQLIFQHVA
jgi:hypothetical protein